MFARKKGDRDSLYGFYFKISDQARLGKKQSWRGKVFCKSNYIFCTSFYPAVNRAYIFLLGIHILLSPIIQTVMCESLRNSYK